MKTQILITYKFIAQTIIAASMSFCFSVRVRGRFGEGPESNNHGPSLMLVIRIEVEGSKVQLGKA